MRTLVAGWFSFEEMGATAGDLASRDVACAWLEEAAVRYDVAHAEPFRGGVDWRKVDPGNYDQVLFVCGPFGNGPPVVEFLERFAGRRLLGLNLTMLDPLEEWDPFDVLFERDSSRTARPDLSFLAPSLDRHVAGVILVHPQSEYSDAMHDAANAAIDRVLAERAVIPVPIDTRLDVNASGLTSPPQVEALISRMDVVVTTRLHGLVYALKNGVPALAVDPIAGGAKVSRQAATLGWPIVFTADALPDGPLVRALDYCLTPEARELAATCTERARRSLARTREAFLATVRDRELEG